MNRTPRLSRGPSRPGMYQSEYIKPVREALEAFAWFDLAETIQHDRASPSVATELAPIILPTQLLPPTREPRMPLSLIFEERNRI